MEPLLHTLWQLVLVLGQLGVELLQLALHYSLLLVWLAWSLWGINWSKTWPVLRQGGWAPLVLILIVSALVWSSIDPAPCACLPFLEVDSFWWQLGAVGLIAGLTLLCGYLQGQLGWTPAEINLEPPAAAHHEHHHH